MFYELLFELQFEIRLIFMFMICNLKWELSLTWVDFEFFLLKLQSEIRLTLMFMTCNLKCFISYYLSYNLKLDWPLYLWLVIWNGNDH
jgi:hypothetical protein